MRNTAPVVAVVQARMSSSRLPGKVLMPIAGKPLLWHIAHRLGQCRLVEQIAIATSTDPSDDAIEAFCAREGIACVRGSLSNVLDRYRTAAERTGAGTLLRVTGDSPLIDPGFVDYLVNAMLSAAGDYAVIEPGALCAHEGVDVFSREALEWLVQRAGEDPIAREHVTSYFKLHPDAVKTVIVPAYPPLEYPHGRLSIDTADDLVFVRALYERAGTPAGELALSAVLKMIREDAALRRINAHVRQKALGQTERHALVCCQGGSRAGLGHVRRSLSLARALRDQQGFGVTVAFHGEEVAADLIKGQTFNAVRLEQADDLLALGASGKFSLAAVDVKDWLGRNDVAALARSIPVLAVIDDGSDRRLAASHAYYPPVPAARALSWAGSKCLPRIGWEWCVLGFDPARMRVERRPHDKPRIVVSMGGADPLHLTDLALDALRQVQRPLQAQVVIGPAFSDVSALAHRIRCAGAEALAGISELAPVLAEADLALVSFGVTAYEAAALRVPALYLPISADHAVSASVFSAAGLGMALAEKPSVGEIIRSLTFLLDNEEQRRAMGEKGGKTVDGQGAFRIAAELTEAAEALAANPQPRPSLKTK